MTIIMGIEVHSAVGDIGDVSPISVLREDATGHQCDVDTAQRLLKK